MRDRIVQISTSRNESEGAFLLVALSEQGNIFVSIANDEADFDSWHRVELPEPATMKATRSWATLR
jgi:hypothetical protein